jgi:uncharacterized protein (DUF302 family)
MLPTREAPEGLRATKQDHAVTSPAVQIRRLKEIPSEGGNPDVGKRAIFGLGHHQAQQQVRRRDRRPTKRFIEVRGFTLFRVIDHSGQAERVGLQMPEMKLVMFGKPTAGAAVMLAGLDLPLKILVWEDGNGAVSVSYNSPGFMAEKYRLDGALRAPFDAIESIVEAVDL